MVRPTLGTPRPVLSKSGAKRDTEWILVATKQDEIVVDHILKRARLTGVCCRRILWRDNGPIRLYSCADDLWRDLLA